MFRSCSFSVFSLHSHSGWFSKIDGSSVGGFMNLNLNFKFDDCIQSENQQISHLMVRVFSKSLYE